MPRQPSSRTAARQARVNQLDSLGTSKMDFFTADELNTADKLVGEFIKRVQDNLKQENMIVTGRIADITMEKVENGMNVYAHKELIYQDKGVNGTENKTINSGQGYTDKRPPVQPFIDWIKERNLVARNNDKLQHGSNYKDGDSPFKAITEEQAITRMAYAMREKVYKQGMKAKNVYSKEIPKLIEDLTAAAGDFVVEEIFNSI